MANTDFNEVSKLTENEHNATLLKQSEKYGQSEKSVCLVYKDTKSDNLVLNQQALDLIENLTGDISIFSVIGEYRSGKSFLLNSIFKKLTNQNYFPFEMGHGEDCITKGCWIQTEQIKIKNKNGDGINILFIDTEGLESESNNEQWDTNLILFNFLICSVFIYNTKSNLSANDFKKLTVVSNLLNKIKLSSNSSRAEDEKKLREDGPHFVCIVRDFHLAEDKYTPKESLQRFLNFEEEEDMVCNKTNKKENNAAYRNEIRKNMLNSFRDFDCFRLPKPVSDETIENKSMEEALQMLDKVAYEKFRKKFIEKFDQMCIWFKNNLEPKCIKNTNMNGKLLCELMKSIVESINNNQIIKLHDTLIAVIKAGIDQEFELIKKEYSNFISNISLPIKKIELDEQNEAKCNELRNRLKIETNSNLYYNYELNLNEYMASKFKEIKDQNEKELKLYNKSKLIEIWKKDYSTRNFETVSDFENLLNSFKKEYESTYQFDINKRMENIFWIDFEYEIEADKLKDALRHKQRQKEIQIEKQKLKIESERNFRESKVKKEINTEKLLDEIIRSGEEKINLKFVNQAECSKNTPLFRYSSSSSSNEYSDHVPYTYFESRNENSSFLKEDKTSDYENLKLRLKEDGTPDMRFRENRIPGFNKDGTLDMRYRENRTPGYNKDGSLDMRYKKNWT